MTYSSVILQDGQQTVVDWAAGTPGKSQWAGPPECMGDILSARAACKLQQAHQVQGHLVTLLILESELNEIFNTWSELQVARHRLTLMEDGLSACHATCLAALYRMGHTQVEDISLVPTSNHDYVNIKSAT